MISSGSYKAFSSGQFTIYVSSSKGRIMPFESVWPRLLLLLLCFFKLASAMLVCVV